MEDEPNWVEELRLQIQRRSDPWVVIEGREAVEAAVAGWWDVSGILVAEECDWKAPEWSGLELTRRPLEALEEFSGAEEHQGVIGLARQPEETSNVASLVEELGQDALVVVCPWLREEQHAGGIVRNAAALGASAVMFGREGVSPFERASLRASSAAIFRVPVRVADAGQILRCLKMAKFQLIGASNEVGGFPIDLLELKPGRTALIIGSEEDGLGSFWRAACDALAHTSMNAEAGRLDPSAASAVYLWEMLRRRREQSESES